MDAADAAKNALSVVLDAKQGERLIIIADDVKSDVAHAFGEGALKLGLWTRLIILKTSDTPRTSIPRDLEEIIVSSPNTDIFINFLRGHGAETPFRIKLVNLETRRNVRLGHCPGTTYDMLTEGALAMTLQEHQQMQQLAKDLIIKLEKCKKVHLTAPGGTDIQLDVSDRPWYSDTFVDWSFAKLKWMNLPTGEVIIGPNEFGANGKLVCDFAMGGYSGEVPEPITLIFENGQVISTECKNKEIKEYVDQTISIDKWAKHVGEFAFGLNGKARVHDEFVETEKIKTVHIAVGNNRDYPGDTKNVSNTHLDFLVKKASVTAFFEDGKAIVIMKDGEYIF